MAVGRSLRVCSSLLERAQILTFSFVQCQRSPPRPPNGRDLRYRRLGPDRCCQQLGRCWDGTGDGRVVLVEIQF